MSVVSSGTLSFTLLFSLLKRVICDCYMTGW